MDNTTTESMWFGSTSPPTCPTLRLDAQTATAWKGIRSEISTLLGLNAPSKSVSVTVDETDNRAGYKRFRYETRFLSQEQLEQVYAFAKELNVPPTAQVINPPQESELWNERKQIEGEGQ